MNKQLMINDIVCGTDMQIGKVIEIYEDRFMWISEEGIEYHGGNTRPLLLTDELLEKYEVQDICKRNGISIDFSRKHKLKVSLLNPDGKIAISYFFPKPQYMHELQHILRQFNQIELSQVAP